MGPLPAIYIDKAKTRLLGVTVDKNLNWIPILQEIVNSFANKLSLLKKSRFLTQSCVRVVLFEGYPAVQYVRDARVGQRKSDGVI